MPSPKDHFGTLSTPFQWLDLPESETLVSQSTRKLENQSTRSTRSTRVLEVPENQKHQSRNPQIKFEGVKVGFSKLRLHQLTRLSSAHLSPGSKFQNLKFEKLGFPHKTLSCSCSLRTSCSCSTNCSCSCKTSCNHP
jgi:hypothetical protein